MSLCLQSLTLENERVMPAISRTKTDVSSLANGSGFGFGKQSVRATSGSCNEIRGMKEFSLINHIESLKCAAYGEIQSPFEGTKNTHDLPQISGAQEAPPLPLPSPSSSSKWALDPGSVEGNLRANSSKRQITCTLEDVVSRVSSCAKQSEGCEDEEVEKSSNRSRKKSSKGSRKKSFVKKESKGSIKADKDPNHSLSSSVFSDLKKKQPDSPIDLSSNDLTVLTALCQRIKIHPKTSNSISIKNAPYSKKSSSSLVNNNVHRKSVSPARASLSNALLEYSKSKKHSSGSDLRKQGGSVQESSKTKVFLSEKQSGIISDCGLSFPCAPPATPTTDQLKRIEYVPSLQDIRSQRSIRQRLQIIESKAIKKERRKQESDEKVEKMSMREKRIEKKRKQRLEIYALNKLMTDLEHERFRQFMAQNGSNV